MALDRRGDGSREAVPIDGQRTASRQFVLVGRAHDDRAAAAHFFMQEANGVMLVVVRAEAVGTNQFGETVGAVRVGGAHRTHFVNDDLGAGLSRLPCGLGAGETAANDMNGF
ncbi:hypothetical protein D9M68_936650 [compost metagenome]